MAKVKYYYNNKTLKYQRIKETPFRKLIKTLVFIISTFVSGALLLLILSFFFESPKEKWLKKDLELTISQYEKLNNDIKEISTVLNEMKKRDENIYRLIFEADPIDQTIRSAGIGGSQKYKSLKKLSNSEKIINISRKTDLLARKLYIQSKSFDELIELAKNKSTMLSSIPSIQPLDNKNLSRIASGWGKRKHPIHGIWKFHYGMDFSAPEGTRINATGDGKVITVKSRRTGYGNYIIIDHGYGYETLYAHMEKFNVKKGQRVKRGQQIGTVGNTGTSVASHLHYEVRKNGKKVDPKFYYYNDLNIEEYERLVEISESKQKSLD